jgi:DNA helicase-2/ATP-dependent DNA helicase PcrA
MNTTPIQKYNDVFGNLNQKQKRAVMQTEGPIMVLAGPGTGKTEVLTTRIAHIIKERGMNAQNILCLTYSNAGVNAMRERLKELIGDLAKEVKISTYHSFSNSIISSYAPDTLQGKSLVSDAQRYMITESLIIKHLSPNDPSEVKPASRKKITNLQKIFSFLKQEGITKKEISEYTEKCINDLLPSEKEYNLINGKGLNKKGRDLKEDILRFSNKTYPMYEDYCKELEKRNLFEFEDMLTEAILLLQSNSNLLKGLQERYQYILIDEFQDSNKKQIAFLDLLVSSVMVPNLFVVGDDDQCIYRFQGASAFNFNWIRKKFANHIEIIHLDTNYRSTQALLLETFGLISLNTDRQPEKQQPLIAGNQNHKTINAETLKFRSYKDAEQEACAIAKSIASELNTGKKASYIAVLARRRYDLEIIKKWLLRFNIPWQLNQSWDNLLETCYGQSMFSLLMFLRIYPISAYDASGFFLQFIQSKKDTKELVKAYLKSSKEKQYDFYGWLKGNQHGITWFNQMEEIIDLLLMSHSTTINDDILTAIEKAINCGSEITPDEISRKVFRDFVHTFKKTYTQKTIPSLAELLWYHNEYEIPIQVANDEEGQDDNAVVLSTIHGTKGLQYDSVYLIACHNKNWEDKSHQGEVRVPDLLNRYISPEADSMVDMRRLIYVACTRAKTKLHISLHRSSPSDKPQKETQLLASFGKLSRIQLEEIPEFELPELESDTYIVKTDPELMELIREKVHNFEISPTSVNTWEQCQNQFFFTQVLKLGGIGSEAPTFGTVVHKVMQKYVHEFKGQEDPELICQLVDKEINQKQHLFHSTHVEKYRNYGKWLLTRYIQLCPINGRPAHIEDEFHTILENGVKIKGTLDRIEINSKYVKVVDYKTGQYKETLRPFESEQQPGSKYWRQAMMYSMLVKDNFKEKGEVKFEFHYPEHKIVVSPFSGQENKRFLNWLKIIWEKINILEFQKICEDPRCVYCRLKLK